MINSDEDFVSALSELNVLYETVDSLRENMNENEFEEASKSVLEKLEVLQEECSHYVDKNTVIETDEEIQS